MRREGKGGAQLQRPSRVTESRLHTGPSSSFSRGRQAKLYTPGGVDDPVLKVFAWPLAAFTWPSRRARLQVFRGVRRRVHLQWAFAADLEAR